MLETYHLGNEEELNLILGINRSIPFVMHLYLVNGWSNSLQMCYICRVHVPGGHLCRKIGSNQIRDLRATYIGVKSLFSSYQYDHGVVHRLLASTTHYCVS